MISDNYQNIIIFLCALRKINFLLDAAPKVECFQRKRAVRKIVMNDNSNIRILWTLFGSHVDATVVIDLVVPTAYRRRVCLQNIFSSILYYNNRSG